MEFDPTRTVVYLPDGPSWGSTGEVPVEKLSLEIPTRRTLEDTDVQPTSGQQGTQEGISSQ